MKAKIFEGWMYRSPGDIIERLVARSVRSMPPASAPVSRETRSHKDRYYTMAQRAKIRRAVKRAKRGER